MIGYFDVEVPKTAVVSRVMVDGKDVRELESRAFSILQGRGFKCSQKDLKQAVKKGFLRSVE